MNATVEGNFSWQGVPETSKKENFFTLWTLPTPDQLNLKQKKIYSKYCSQMLLPIVIIIFNLLFVKSILLGKIIFLWWNDGDTLGESSVESKVDAPNRTIKLR